MTKWTVLYTWISLRENILRKASIQVNFQQTWIRDIHLNNFWLQTPQQQQLQANRKRYKNSAFTYWVKLNQINVRISLLPLNLGNVISWHSWSPGMSPCSNHRQITHLEVMAESVNFLLRAVTRLSFTATFLRWPKTKKKHQVKSWILKCVHAFQPFFSELITEQMLIICFVRNYINLTVLAI